MTVFIVKINGHPKTYPTFKRAAWALTFWRLSYPHARITFKRTTLPRLP